MCKSPSDSHPVTVPGQQPFRILLAHLNPLSARLHFWVAELDTGSTACLFEGIPALSSIHDKASEAIDDLHTHPGVFLAQLAEWLGCDQKELDVVEPQLEWIEMPGQWAPVCLVRLTCKDLPTLKPAGRFITLMELLQIPEPERLLLRYGYEALLGD